MKEKIKEKIKPKIQIHPACLPVIVFAVMFGFGKELFFLFLAVTLHEMAHVLVGRFFHLSVSKLILTPLGEIALLKNIEDLYLLPRLAVVLAGPSINLLLFLIFGADQPFGVANLALCFFNLLPIYPMDGGRFWHILVGNRIGVLRANRILIAIGRVFASLLFVLGLVQVVLFPFNMSLLCAAVYLIKNSRREQLRLYYEFYRYFNTKRFSHKKILPARTFIVAKDFSKTDMLREFRWDSYCLFYVQEEEESLSILTEKMVMDSVFRVSFK
jgi:stage IV sporulation protein FB